MTGEEIMRKSLAIGTILMSAMLFVQAEEKSDVWQPLEFLEGTWEAQTENSSVTQVYQFILNKKFLQMKTRAVFMPTEKNPKGETHEDMGIFSYDQSRKKFVLRGFYVEGFVNQYVLEDIPEDGKAFTFVTEQIENAPPGTKAKLVYKVITKDEVDQSFHVAWPGKEFSCYSINKLKRKE